MPYPVASAVITAERAASSALDTAKNKQLQEGDNLQ